MYNVQCTMYNVQCTMYNVQCTVIVTTGRKSQDMIRSSHSSSYAPLESYRHGEVFLEFLCLWKLYEFFLGESGTLGIFFQLQSANQFFEIKLGQVKRQQQCALQSAKTVEFSIREGSTKLAFSFNDTIRKCTFIIYIDTEAETSVYHPPCQTFFSSLQEWPKNSLNCFSLIKTSWEGMSPVLCSAALLSIVVIFYFFKVPWKPLVLIFLD